MWELLAQFDWLEPFRSTSGQRIMLVGALTNVACALVGCYLVLRRMSLMGDAIAHAVLPGIVIAFVFSGSMNIVPLFIGAALVGLLTTFLTQTLHQFGRVPTDAAMGAVFTSLFALGVVLLKRYISGMHFDVACVYEGSLTSVALDTVSISTGLFGDWEVPRQLESVLPIVVLNLVMVLLFWKEFKLSSFDTGMATSMGYSATLLHYVLMALVAMTSVAAFQAVGSILVVAMLIVPPATAQLLCDRLSRMVLLACVFAVAAAVGGYWLAHEWDVSPAGAMSVFAGGMYAIAVLFAPKYGIVSTLVRNLQTSIRILREDLLSMVYRDEELGGAPLSASTAVAAVGGGWQAWWALGMLRRRGRLTLSADGLQLTDDGRERAKRLVRGHRLWEAYLVKHLGLPLDHVHAPADRVEHYLSEPLRDELQKAVDNPQQDPHGREIPDARL
ncbi:MAG: metal ABC transporter permease [Pirellulales bacterium]